MLRKSFMWLYAQSWGFRVGILSLWVVVGTFACIAAVAWLTGNVRATMLSIWIRPLAVGAFTIWLGGKAFRNNLR